ncbi:hypothetical protein IQ268_24415 [Oculatella sp. LEGE 06141]|uniref:hypothetical protein n=1 Tax=Oculatella sp. LEGE 06141 TaxID=1828648 RepID=UPI001882860C|nr:hypothetical protein [Oculatella sp. LEGE 06141]MBE9181714.1 hypothetical protein [Oculatella sp. LEGE 06141]
MLPNLLEATKDYWRKLDEVEAAYQRGDLTVAEVDAKVQDLMVELGQERRATLHFVADGCRRLWHEQREAIVGVTLIGVLTYAWVVVS